MSSTSRTRSHGALGELNIPFIINQDLAAPDFIDSKLGEPARLHNYDAFWIATTGVTQQP